MIYHSTLSTFTIYPLANWQFVPEHQADFSWNLSNPQLLRYSHSDIIVIIVNHIWSYRSYSYVHFLEAIYFHFHQPMAIYIYHTHIYIHICVWYTYTYTHTYIYIYTYIHYICVYIIYYPMPPWEARPIAQRKGLASAHLARPPGVLRLLRGHGGAGAGAFGRRSAAFFPGKTVGFHRGKWWV